MSDSTSDRSQHEQQIDAIIAEYYQAEEEGRAPDQEEFLRRHPEFSADLREFFADYKQFEKVAQPLVPNSTATAAYPPPQVNGYENLIEIGRGGMGVVYRARQQSTHRPVAIKVIRPERLETLKEGDREEIVARFRIEAIAMKEHENIVRLYHTGSVGGYPFFVMELVQGRTLRSLVQSGDCSVIDIVAFLEQAARGIHHAHRHGVLHRDIKPANILVDEQTRTAKVADFGLAKLDHLSVTEAPPNSSENAAVMGTLPYMSPEQAIDSDSISVASDVYSLGATLYEALSGQPPFRGDLADVRKAIATEQPPPLRELNLDIPNRLERICVKCLSKDPSDRFDSAESFADHLAQLRTASIGNAALYFANMGWSLLLFGFVGLAIHVGVYWLVEQKCGELFVWLTLFSVYLPLFAMLWFTKMPERYETKAVERELWSIWFGQFLGAGVAFTALRMVTGDLVTTLAAGYPVFAAITAMAHIASAATFWRFHYVLAGTWFVAALIMIWTPGLAPIEFGIAMAIASFVVGIYELYLGREQLMDKSIRVLREDPTSENLT